MAALVTTIAYHRNGVSGDPFYVALLDDSEEGQLVALMPSAAVDEKEKRLGDVQCYVLNVDTLKEGIVAFLAGAYRGDHYFDLVCAAAKAYEDGTFENTVDAVDPSERIREAVEQLGLGGEPRARPSSLAERSA